MITRPPDPRRLLIHCLLLLAPLFSGCQSSSRQLLDRADASWRKERYDEAIQINQEVYKRERGGKFAARALLNIGNIYYLNLRQIKPAVESYDRLAKEFPEIPETLQAHRQLAAIYANEVSDLDQAIAQYDRLLEAQDLVDRAEILFQRADAYFKKEDYDRALRELSNLEESGVSGHLGDQVSLKIGNIYQIQKRFVDAIDPLRKVLGAECAECRRRATLSLADTYENLFEFDHAIETIRRLDNSPENDIYIRNEVDRLEKKRREVERSHGLEWDQPRVIETPSKAPKAQTARKRAAPSTGTRKK